MTDDATIAALERAADTADMHARRHRAAYDYPAANAVDKDAALIRAHIAKLRAADAVDERAAMSRVVGAAAVVGEKNGEERERAKVVAWLRDRTDDEGKTLQDAGFYADAIEAGAHQEAGE